MPRFPSSSVERAGDVPLEPHSGHTFVRPRQMGGDADGLGLRVRLAVRVPDVDAAQLDEGVVVCDAVLLSVAVMLELGVPVCDAVPLELDDRVAVGVPVGAPTAERPRTRALSRSAIKTKPPCAVTPVGPFNIDNAPVAWPSPASPAVPLPATDEMTPAGVIMRTTLAPNSAT